MVQTESAAKIRTWSIFGLLKYVWLFDESTRNTIKDVNSRKLVKLSFSPLH